MKFCLKTGFLAKFLEKVLLYISEICCDLAVIYRYRAGNCGKSREKAWQFSS